MRDTGAASTSLPNLDPNQGTAGRLHADELRSIAGWIALHGAPGQPCDECGLPFLEGDRRMIVTARVIYGHLLYLTCERCREKTGNIKADADEIVGRIISPRAAMILTAPKETVQ